MVESVIGFVVVVVVAAVVVVVAELQLIELLHIEHIGQRRLLAVVAVGFVVAVAVFVVVSVIESAVLD